MVLLLLLVLHLRHYRKYQPKVFACLVVVAARTAGVLPSISARLTVVPTQVKSARHVQRRLFLWRALPYLAVFVVLFALHKKLVAYPLPYMRTRLWFPMLFAAVFVVAGFAPLKRLYHHGLCPLFVSGLTLSILLVTFAVWGFVRPPARQF